jgi:hypothetical protein
VQIWFEAEAFTERSDGGAFFPVVCKSGAFGRAVTRAGGGGRIRYDFDIDAAGGLGGTWYFWGRLVNPANQSDYLVVEDDPDDLDLIEDPPFPGGDGTYSNDDDRVFEENTGPPWGWARASHAEGHTKELRDGLNSMFLFRRSGNATVFWDVFLWTDDPGYVPSDDDYVSATPINIPEPPAPVFVFKRGDVDANGTIEITDPISNLSFQFLGDFQPPCLDALDWDDNGAIDVTDPIGSLTRQFLGGDPAPPPGSTECGEDPTPDGNGDLGCEAYPAASCGG